MIKLYCHHDQFLIKSLNYDMHMNISLNKVNYFFYLITIMSIYNNYIKYIILYVLWL